jgi:hypothetical protein
MWAVAPKEKKKIASHIKSSENLPHGLGSDNMLQRDRQTNVTSTAGVLFLRCKECLNTAIRT